MHSGQDGRPAAVIKMNQSIMEQLGKKLGQDPSLDIESEFMSIYDSAYLTLRRPLPVTKKHTPKRNDYARDSIDAILLHEKHVKVAQPLSSQAENAIFAQGEGEETARASHKQLARCLHRLLSDPQIIFEGPMGSTVIWKISDTLVAKLGSDTTEYSALQYLAQHAPELPVPKPHGLITWYSSHLTLMTHIPSTTRRAAWPSLSEDNRMSIREELGKIVTAWRSIPVEPGVRLGDIGGEGVRDFHGWEGDESKEVMTTAHEFSDWQFSYCSHATESWRGLVQSVTPPVGPDEPIVLTHGDLWPANIMVDKDTDGLFHVTGIIDWGESGFYPAYFEESKMLHVFGFGSKDDWWRYLPECLAPSTDPQRWLATHLWHQTCK